MTRFTAVVSSQAQYEALIRQSGVSAEDIELYSDTPVFFPFLQNRNLAFEPVEEESLRSQWGEINAWCCQKAVGWLDESARKKYFQNLPLDHALYLRLSYNLCLVLRNYLFAKNLLDRNPEKTWLVFSGEAVEPFPYPRGNVLLNRWIKTLAQERKIPIIEITTAPLNRPRSGTVWAKQLRSGLLQLIRLFYRPQLPARPFFLFCGALNHLKGFTSKAPAEASVFFDFDFNFTQFLFCLKNSIPYVDETALQHGIGDRKASSPESQWDDWMSFFKELCESGYFDWKGCPLGSFLYENVFQEMRGYFNQFNRQIKGYDALLSARPIQAVVLDEDIAINRALMAAFFKSREVPVYCVSHGFYPVNFSAETAPARFSLAKTFVQSNYEAAIYRQRCWDGQALAVTGVPRFDALIQMRAPKWQNFKGISDHARMRILYCGTNVRPYTPDRMSYLGIHKFICDTYTRLCLRDLVRALSGKTAQLTLKPHRIDDLPNWKALVQELAPAFPTKIASGKAPFFKLLSESDVMVVGHWSTAILESLLLGVPTIVMDYSNHAVPFEVYDRNPLCWVVENSQELNSALQEVAKLLSDTDALREAQKACWADVYLLGTQDGHALDRVWQKILNPVHESRLREAAVAR